jgi:hypothetical protein
MQSMALADTQQERLFARLRKAGGQPVAFADLRAAGIDFPAAVVCELQLNGYAIERVYDDGRLVGVRLVHPDARQVRAAPQRRQGRGDAGSRPRHTVVEQQAGNDPGQPAQCGYKS